MDRQETNPIQAALASGIEFSTTPVAVVAERGGVPVIDWANRAMCDRLLADIGQLQGRPVDRFVTCDWAEAFSTHRSQRLDVTLRSKAGEMSQWSVESHPHSGEGVRRWSWLFTASDASVQGGDDDLAERFRVLSERAPIGIFSSEVGLRFGYVNDWFADLVGYPADHLLGMGWTSVIAPDDLDLVMGGLQEVLAGTPFEASARLISAAGEERWVTFRVISPGGRGPAAFLGTIEDITDRRRFEELLHVRATRDPLTGLKNRSELLGDIEEALGTGRDDVTVMFIDLDDFKLVNDLMGHAAGDELLKTIGDRLLDSVRTSDTVYRYAGDEFVVLLHGGDARGSDPVRAADRIHKTLSQPVSIAGHPTDVGCSLGAATARVGSSAESLLADADAAMYEAKRRGKSHVVMFDPSMSEAHSSHNEYLRSTRDAILGRRVEFRYEPMICIGESDVPTIIGPRAVLVAPSWTSLDGTRYFGEDLWDAARDLERLPALLTNCIDVVCRDLARWRNNGIEVPWGAVVHLHARDLAMPGFVDHVARSLLRSKLNGDDITLVLSGLDIGVPAPVLDTMNSLRDLGVRIWADWGSITLPTLMLDGLRPAGVSLDLGEVGINDLDTCHAIVEMLHSTDIRTGARGLNTLDSVGHAISIGLRYGAGPAIGPALSAAELIDNPSVSHFAWTAP